jgi:hypothetical protein
VQAVVGAHAWLKLLTDCRRDSVKKSLSRTVDLQPKHVRNAIRLAFLSPAIIKSMVCVDQHAKLLGDLAKAGAFSWDKQQRQLHPTQKS